MTTKKTLEKQVEYWKELFCNTDKKLDGRCEELAEQRTTINNKDAELSKLRLELNAAINHQGSISGRMVRLEGENDILKRIVFGEDE